MDIVRNIHPVVKLSDNDFSLPLFVDMTHICFYPCDIYKTGVLL